MVVLLKLRQVLWSALNMSSVAIDVEVRVSISEDGMCLQMLAALPMCTQYKDPRTG